jgi:hypothetical protein
MTVEGTPGHVRLHADLFDAGVIDTLGFEKAIGRVLDAAANLLLPFLAAPQGCLYRVHEVSVM